MVKPGLVITALAIALASAPALPAAAAPVTAAVPDPQGGFSVDDYFRLTHHRGLALSSDGMWIAYAAETMAAEGDGAGRIFLQLLSGDGATASPEGLADASALGWIPGTHRLAFLSARSGSRQLHS